MKLKQACSKSFGQRGRELQRSGLNLSAVLGGGSGEKKGSTDRLPGPGSTIGRRSAHRRHHSCLTRFCQVCMANARDVGDRQEALAGSELIRHGEGLIAGVPGGARTRTRLETWRRTVSWTSKFCKRVLVVFTHSAHIPDDARVRCRPGCDMSVDVEQGALPPCLLWQAGSAPTLTCETERVDHPVRNCPRQILLQLGGLARARVCREGRASPGGQRRIV